MKKSHNNNKKKKKNIVIIIMKFFELIVPLSVGTALHSPLLKH